MKGVVKFKDGHDGWEVREIDRPDPLDDEVEIEVKCAGICGSELHLYHDNHTYTPETVIGHEFAGQIVRVGKNVTKWKVGDRVVSENNKRTCGVCDACRMGRPILCPDRKPVGYKVNGGWTSYFCTPEKWLIKIPDNVTFEEAAMTEPVTIATQGQIVRGTVQINDNVLVQGCGTIGLINAMVARAIGAKNVIITGTDADNDVRLPIAKKLGFENIINVQRQDLKAEIMRITEGEGVDVIIEASGSEIAINQMPELLKKRGTVLAIGETPKPVINFPWAGLLFKSTNVVFTFGAEYSAWKHALNLMGSKLINLEPLITHKIDMADYAEGFKLLDEKKALKVIMYPKFGK